MGRKRGIYYVNPEELKQDLYDYRDTGEISESLGAKLILIAERFSRKWNFRNYSYKDDFIGDAILRMVCQLDKINLDHPKCNPFSYLSITCENSMKANLNKESKFKRVKDTLTDYYFEELEQNEGIVFKKNDDED